VTPSQHRVCEGVGIFVEIREYNTAQVRRDGERATRQRFFHCVHAGPDHQQPFVTHILQFAHDCTNGIYIATDVLILTETNA